MGFFSSWFKSYLFEGGGLLKRTDYFNIDQLTCVILNRTTKNLWKKLVILDNFLGCHVCIIHEGSKFLQNKIYEKSFCYGQKSALKSLKHLEFVFWLWLLEAVAQRYFVKNVFLETSQNLQKTPVPESLFNKFAGLRRLIKIRRPEHSLTPTPYVR